MARLTGERDISPTLTAAVQWMQTSLIADRSLFSTSLLWTAALVEECRKAFVEHPDAGKDDFMTKLKRQMQRASPPAQQLVAEMLWALLLFPSNMKARTKRQQVSEVWALSGQQLAQDHSFLTDGVLVGVGSGGPGFNNYRPEELAFLVAVAGDLKQSE